LATRLTIPRFYIKDNNGMNGTEGLVAGLHVGAFSCHAGL